MAFLSQKINLFFSAVLILLILIGVALRFYQITENNFVYYDEGLFLDHNSDFLYYMKQHPADSWQKTMRYLEICGHMALAQGKALWGFIANLRAFILDVQAWYFLRLVSAIFGSLALVMIYFFARRFFQSHWIGLSSAAMLAVFPSHLYYSRIGLQEALSAFCFLVGMYFYVFSKRLHFKIFISAFFFACVYYVNYRMIVIPLLLAFTELFLSFAKKERMDIQKYVWNVLTFFAFVFLIGAIDKGANTNIVFAWMFYQSHLAHKEPFDIINLFSYPYYLFKLESFIFCGLFFANAYFFISRQWWKAFPFLLAILQMFMFSFAQEKGVRYVCVVMPFMVMAVVALLFELYQLQKKNLWRRLIIILSMIMVGIHIFKANTIVRYQSDYKQAIIDLRKTQTNVKVMSSQPLLQKMYTESTKYVAPLPHQWQMFTYLFMNGYRYIVIDPQAYVSFTANQRRFSLPLETYLGFIDKNVPPEKIYPHFGNSLLERFVLEHNTNLRQSLKFLHENKDGKLSTLRVYDVQKCLMLMKQVQQLRQIK